MDMKHEDAMTHHTHTTFTGNTIMATSPSEITVESNILEDKVQAAVERQVGRATVEQSIQ